MILDHSQIFVPSIQDEEISPTLAVVKFSRRDQPDWTHAELVNFFTVVHNSLVSTWLVFVIFIQPSKPMFYNLMIAIKEIGNIKSTTVQWGTFSSDDDRWVDKSLCDQEMEVVLYFGMSNEVHQNWREVF
jgi:hypothetical protein